MLHIDVTCINKNLLPNNMFPLKSYKYIWLSEINVLSNRNKNKPNNLHTKRKKNELLVLAMRKDLSQNTSCVKTALNF